MDYANAVPDAAKIADAHFDKIMETLDVHGVPSHQQAIIKNAYLFVFEHAFMHGVRYARSQSTDIGSSQSLLKKFY